MTDDGSRRRQLIMKVVAIGIALLFLGTGLLGGISQLF